MNEEDEKRICDDLTSRVVRLFQNALGEWPLLGPDALLNVLGGIRSTIIADYMHEDRPTAAELKLEDKLSTDEDYEPSDEDVEDD